MRLGPGPLRGPDGSGGQAARGPGRSRMLALWASCLLVGCASALAELAPIQAASSVTSVEDPREAITAASLEAHVRLLAADDLAGRATGSEGCVRAGDYLARQLAAAGLEPAGDHGTFRQSLPFGRREYTDLPELWLEAGAGPEQVVYGIDFDSVGGLPEDRWLELRVCRDAADVPEPDAGLALFLAGNSREREAWLDEREGYGLLLWAGSRRAGSRAQTRLPRARRWVGEGPATTATARVRGPLAERFEAGEISGVRLVAPAEDSAPPVFNVVGRLPGHGVLAEEIVVYTAHYDHIGLAHAPSDEDGEEDDTEGSPDLVNNGADDDASGCAAVLELARALAADARAAPDTHRRTQLFLLVTAEEIGLLGTNYYLDHPIEPLEGTVCNVNFEMIGRPDALVGGAGRLWLTGFERTNLGAAWRAEGVEIEADGRPDQQFFRRSDNYAFAVRGIVAQSLSTYDLHGDYHQVSDEADTLDYPHMETCVRTALDAARLLADGSIYPAWNPGGAPTSR